jgi:WD40 repeat protein
VNGIGVSPDGKRIATRGMDSRVCVWDATTGKELSHAPATWTNTPNIDFSPDGKFLYVGGPAWGEVTKLDAASGKEVAKFITDPKSPKQASIFSVRLSKDGKTVFGLSGPYSSSDPGFVTTWNATTGERTKATQLPVRVSHGGELSPDGNYVAVGAPDEGGVFAVGKLKKDLLVETKLRGILLPAGRFSDDGKWFTQTSMEQGEGGWTHSVAVISTLNWGVACTIPMKTNGKAGLSPDGRTLAVADGEKLEFFDTATARSLGSYRVPVGEWGKARFGHVNVLCFTPDGTKLITGHIDTTALVWSVPPRPAK